MNSEITNNSNTVQSVYIDPKDSPVEYQRQALVYWENKRGDRMAPAWSEISLMDFPPKVIPAIMVTDIDHVTGDLKYRFFGTQLTELHGGDYTGKSPADLLPKLHGDAAENGYKKLIREKHPHLEIKEFYRLNNLLGRQMVLRLPLSDDNLRVSNGMAITYQEIVGTNRPHSDFFDHVLSAKE